MSNPFINNKIKYFTVVFMLLLSFPTCALAITTHSTLHAIILADTDGKDIGQSSEVDVKNMKHLVNTIEKYAGIKANTTVLKGNKLTRSNIEAVINKLTVTAEDVVIFYYSGHGYRHPDTRSPWPYLVFCIDKQQECDKASDYEEIDFDEIVKKLVNKKPRFLIALADSCNAVVPELEVPSEQVMVTRDVEDVLAEGIVKTAYQKLFLDYRGYIVASGAKPEQLSWTIDSKGSVFTNTFLETLKNNILSYVFLEDDLFWFPIIRKTKILISMSYGYLKTSLQKINCDEGATLQVEAVCSDGDTAQVNFKCSNHHLSLVNEQGKCNNDAKIYQEPQYLVNLKDSEGTKIIADNLDERLGTAIKQIE